MHLLKLLSPDHALHVVDDVDRIETGNVCAPSSSDPLGPVDEHKGDDRQVEFRLDLLAVFVQVDTDAVVLDEEYVSCDLAEQCVQVPGAGRIVSTLKHKPVLSDAADEEPFYLESGSELAFWDKQIDIVRADVVVCQADDRGGH